MHRFSTAILKVGFAHARAYWEQLSALTLHVLHFQNQQVLIAFVMTLQLPANSVALDSHE